MSVSMAGGTAVVVLLVVPRFVGGGKCGERGVCMCKGLVSGPMAIVFFASGNG